MLMNLFKFKGGVKPPTNKTQSNHLPIAVAPLPSRLVVPLHQSIGGTPRPVVSAGDQVLKGQLIGEADGWVKYETIEDLRAEKVREDALRRAGWTIVRWTSDELWSTPMLVIARIARALAGVR